MSNLSQNTELVAAITMQTSRQPRKDYVMLGVSILFTGASLISTVQGARALLGDTPWAWTLGLGVQAVPFLLATGLAGRNLSRSLKATIGALCFSLSIYASTAWFIPNLGGASIELQARQITEEAHARFVAAVLAPLKSEAQDADAKVLRMEQRLVAEKAHGLEVAKAGIGRAYRRQKAELIDLRAKASVAAGRLADTEQRVLYDSAGLTPNEILSKDREAWQAAPADVRRASVAPTADAYLPAPEQSSALTRPLHGLLNRSPFAAQAFFVAFLLDLVGLLVGLGVPVSPARPRIGVIRRLGAAFTDIARAIEQSWETFLRGLHRPADPLFVAAVEEEGQLSLALSNIETILNHSIGDFLRTLLCAMKPESCSLDVAGLREEFKSDPAKAYSLSIILTALATPELGWVESGEDGAWTSPSRERFATLQTYLLKQRLIILHEQGAATSKPTPDERRLLVRILQWLANLLSPPSGPTSPT